MKQELLITKKTLTKFSRELLQIARYNESGLVINPVGDYFFTLPYILGNKNLLKQTLGRLYKSYIFVKVDLGDDQTIQSINIELIKECVKRKVKIKISSDLESNIEYLVKKGYEVVFLYLRLDRKFLDIENLLLNLELISKTQRVSMIYFTEVNLANDMFSTQHHSYTAIFQNIVYQGYYDYKDVKEFIVKIAEKWNIDISKNLADKIYEVCGGSLWLIKQALRNIRQDKKAELLNSPVLIMKAKASWGQFLDDEKDVIRNVAQRKKEFLNISSLNYLLRVNVIRKKGELYESCIKLLSRAAENEINNKKMQLVDKKIFIDGVEITKKFSPKELKVLIFFLKNRNKLIDRLSIKKLFTDKNKIYSDYAVDKTISRLRSSLINLGFDRKIITTRKGEGYVFS